MSRFFRLRTDPQSASCIRLEQTAERACRGAVALRRGNSAQGAIVPSTSSLLPHRPDGWTLNCAHCPNFLLTITRKRSVDVPLRALTDHRPQSRFGSIPAWAGSEQGISTEALPFSFNLFAERMGGCFTARIVRAHSFLPASPLRSGIEVVSIAHIQ